jgi:excisionase family DNA binding protein
VPLPLLVTYMIHSRILDDVCEVKFQLPVRDIAERYNFSLPTIYEWMRRGHIRGKKQGRRVIIDVPSLERFLQQKGYLTTTKD